MIAVDILKYKGHETRGGPKGGQEGR